MNDQITGISLTRNPFFVGNMMNLRVLLDGKDIGYLPCSTRKTFEVSPGEHNLQVKMEMSWSKSLPKTIRVEKGEVKYYYCDLKYRGLCSILNVILPVIFRINEGNTFSDEELKSNKDQIEKMAENFFIKSLAPLMCANVVGVAFLLLFFILVMIFGF